jgi:hypothetical protein
MDWKYGDPEKLSSESSIPIGMIHSECSSMNGPEGPEEEIQSHISVSIQLIKIARKKAPPKGK